MNRPGPAVTPSPALMISDNARNPRLTEFTASFPGNSGRTKSNKVLKTSSATPMASLIQKKIRSELAGQKVMEYIPNRNNWAIPPMMTMTPRAIKGRNSLYFLLQWIECGI